MARVTVVLLAAFGFFGLASVSLAQPAKLTVTATSDQASDKSFAAALERAIKAAGGASAVSFRKEADVAQLIESLLRSDSSVALTDGASVRLATAGEKPFKVASQGLTVIAVLHSGAPVTPILSSEFSAKHSVVNFDDALRRNLPIRVGVPEPGTVEGAVAERVLAGVGASAGTVKGAGGSWTAAPYATLVSDLKAKKLDLIVVARPPVDTAIADLMKTGNYRILSPSDPTILAAGPRIGTERVLMPSLYPSQNVIHTAANVVVLAAGPRLAEKDGYALAKALITSAKDIQSSYKDFGPALAVTRTQKLHPGAERYYRETGLLK